MSVGHRRKGKRDSWNEKLKLVSNAVVTRNKEKNKKDPLDLSTERSLGTWSELFWWNRGDRRQTGGDCEESER